MHGLQGDEASTVARDLGMNTLYLNLEFEDLKDLSRVDAKVKSAREAGLGVIVAIPTVPRSFSVVPSAGGETYREWVAALITRVAEHLRGNPAVVAWAMGDYLERHIDYNVEDFRRFLQTRYATPEDVGESWGRPIANWADADEPAARENDKQFAFGVGRALVDVADFHRQAFADVMSHWAETLRALDTSRPLMTGRISLFRDLTAVPPGYDIVCPYMPPGEYNPDPVTHNVHAVDMARRAGRFEVLPTLEVPQSTAAFEDGTVRRWVNLSGLHGACGVGFADWARVTAAPAPKATKRDLKQLVQSVPLRQTFSIRPRPSVAFLYEPYGSGVDNKGLPAYGYLQGFSPAEPSNPFLSFRLGCRYGLVDYLTLEDLPLHDLNSYGAILAPMAVNLPEPAQVQLGEFVYDGGALVADLGLGMYQGGSWLDLPPLMTSLFGVDHAAGMAETLHDLSMALPPPWLPSVTAGMRTQGTFNLGVKEGTAAQRKSYHVQGPALLVVPQETARILGVAETKYVQGKLAFSGIVGKETGLGVACLATHRLWAYWKASDPAFMAFHQDLLARSARVEMLDSGFWPAGLCVTATEDGIALSNSRSETSGVDVAYRDAQHRLFTKAFCGYSALARTADGLRSGAARLSVVVPPGETVQCHALPISVQPFAFGCLARVLDNTPERIRIELGGAGASVATAASGTAQVGEGEPVEVRFTIRNGLYPVTPGSSHRVKLTMDGSKPVEAVMQASAGGELRFSEMVSHGVLTVTKVP
ncbi:beta-galactosidase [bacterium]|nr:beta-galactosidase [bacterium]